MRFDKFFTDTQRGILGFKNISQSTQKTPKNTGIKLRVSLEITANYIFKNVSKDKASNWFHTLFQNKPSKVNFRTARISTSVELLMQSGMIDMLDCGV